MLYHYGKYQGKRQEIEKKHIFHKEALNVYDLYTFISQIFRGGVHKKTNLSESIAHMIT